MKLANYCKFNYRPIVTLAIAIIAGVFCGALLYNTTYGIVIGVILFSVASCISIFKGKFWYTLCIMGLLIGIICLSIFMTTQTNRTSYNDTIISCKITKEQGYTNTDYPYAYWVEDIAIDNESLHTTGIVYTYQELELFSYITVSGDAINFVPDPLSSYDATNYQNGLRYNICAHDILQANHPTPNIIESKIHTVKETLIRYLGAENGGFVISILFGDKSYMTPSLLNTMSTTGLSHIMSVSGLHVSFVIAMTYFVLKKLKLHNAITLTIAMCVLLLYGYITDFPVSLIRASIMYFIASLSNILGMRYDMLNSIALTTIIILIFAPITLFNISFQLSFTAILGICLFYRTINSFLHKHNHNNDRFMIKIKKLLFASISMSLSSNILLFPIIIHYFGYFGTYFILANLVIVPSISLLFSFMWILIAIMLLAPLLTPITVCATKPVSFIIKISELIANLPLARLPFQSMGILTFAYIPTVALLSEANCASKVNKARFGFTTLTISAIITLFI